MEGSSNGKDKETEISVKKIAKPLTKKRLFLKYITTTLIITATVIAVSAIAVFGFIVVNGKKNVSANNTLTPKTLSMSPLPTVQKEEKVKEASTNSGFWDSFIEAPRKTNILLLGMDQSSLLSDVIILVSFDSVTKSIDMISIPRDTYVTITDGQVKELNEAGIYPPYSMKLTDLHSYAGKKLGHIYSTGKVEEILDINIDYYAEIDISAFKDIVDAVGGIYMDVPEGGLFYSDPDQDLYISVPSGRQLLDGGQAEGVVRYRNTYTRGDLDRIDMQKRFMKEFFVQVLNKDALINNMMDFISAMISYVKTDFGITDIPQYLTSLDGISGDNMNFYTLPGEAEYFSGGWYYVFDEEETRKLVNETILDYGTDEKVTGDIKIKLFNGSDKSTIAIDIKEGLQDSGYYVHNAGDYTGTKTNATRIFVRDESEGEALKQYFKQSKIITEEEIPPVYDVMIILGRTE